MTIEAAVWLFDIHDWHPFRVVFRVFFGIALFGFGCYVAAKSSGRKSKAAILLAIVGLVILAIALGTIVQFLK